MIPLLARTVVVVAPLAPTATRQEAHALGVQPLMVTRSVVSLGVLASSSSSVTIQNVGGSSVEGTLWLWHRHSFVL